MFRRALAGIDYTSPVCKINIAVDKIPNFLADPNTSEHMVAPMMTVTIIYIYMDMMMITRMMMTTRIRMMMTGDAAPPSNHPPQLWKERDAGGGLQGCQGGGNIFKVITLSEYVPCLSPNNNKHHHNWLFIRRPMIEMTIPSSLDSTLAPPGHHICLVFSQ